MVKNKKLSEGHVLHLLSCVYFIWTISSYVLGPQGFDLSESCLNVLWNCVIDLKKGTL